MGDEKPTEVDKLKQMDVFEFHSFLEIFEDNQTKRKENLKKHGNRNKTNR